LLQAKREEYGDVVWAEMDGLVDLKNDWKEVLVRRRSMLDISIAF
jgi:hypothetical protein